MTKTPEKVHGTCIEVDGLGILLRGSSGSGKSDLALRLIEDGARLISDDYTELSVSAGRLIARAPAKIEGLLEVRGVGVLKIGAALQAELGAIIDLVAPKEIERLPEDKTEELFGVVLPLYCLTPFEASAPAKVRLVVRRVKEDIVHVP